MKNEFDVNENRLMYKLKNLEKCIYNLEKAINILQTTDEVELVKMAIIQYYEICVEVSHSFFVKFLRDLGERISVDTAKKVVIRKLSANINFDEKSILNLYKAVDVRNKTSHEYKDWYEVYGDFIVKNYLPTMKNLIKVMRGIFI